MLIDNILINLNCLNLRNIIKEYKNVCIVKDVIGKITSFTDDNIGNALLARKDQIKIMGVFEKQQNSPLYSEYQKLLDAGIKVRVDGNKYKMHNKVMIIDGKIVAFGSYNPTANGNKENDENLVIDHTPSLALQFEKEFERVYSLGIQ